jgi:hypothetical protein
MLLNSPRGPQCSMCDLPSESELITLNFFLCKDDKETVVT